MGRLLGLGIVLIGLIGTCANGQNYDKMCRTLLSSCQTFQTECQSQSQQPQPNRPNRPQNPLPPQPQPQPPQRPIQPPGPQPQPQPGFQPNPVISPTPIQPAQCVGNGKGCNTSEECCSLNCKVETITMGNENNKFTIKVCR